MADSDIAAHEACELISRCLAGEPEATRQFQDRYGELIYGYPMRVYRIPTEEAADFYVFAFDRGRIFRRLRTFEGRAPLRAYLLGFVLDNLVLEWKRGEREIETVSIESISELADPHGSVASSVETVTSAAARASLSEILSGVEVSKTVLLKLLYIEDYELGGADIRYLAEVSGRSVPDLLLAVDQLRSRVCEREVGLKRIEDALEAVQAWIHLYERRLRRIADDLADLPPTATGAVRLRDEHAELERKLRWRKRQRTGLLSRAQRRKVTAPYKDIAALLNTSVGNVASQIARLRQVLRKKGLQPDAGRQRIGE